MNTAGILRNFQLTQIDLIVITIQITIIMIIN